MPDGDDFTALCQANWPIVFRTAFLLTGDRNEAEDLAQEAFVRAFERWQTVSALDRPEAWLQRVVANLSISWRRRLSTSRRNSPLIVARDDHQMPMDIDLVRALRALTPSQRAAVVLRFYADRSIEDVASALGKRPGTIRALTAQGVAKLRDVAPSVLQEVTDEDPR